MFEKNFQQISCGIKFCFIFCWVTKKLIKFLQNIQMGWRTFRSHSTESGEPKKKKSLFYFYEYVSFACMVEETQMISYIST